MSKKQITVAVSGLNATDNPGAGIPVIRSIRESKIYDSRIIGLSYKQLDPGIYMPEMVNKTYWLPPVEKGSDALLERIKYIHSKEKLDLIIPNFDTELASYISIKPQIQQLGIHILIPTIDQFNNRLKCNLQSFGALLGLLTPFDIIINDSEEINEKLSEISYPIVVKGKFSDAYIGYSSEQARHYISIISEKWGFPIILQAYISGEEFNVTALGDGKGSLMGAVVMQKKYTTSLGKAWAGISIEHQVLIDLAKKVVQNLKWEGGIELEVIEEKNSKKLYLIEINPRFPAWIYFATACGQNHPEALIQLAFNNPIAPLTSYKSGKIFIRYAFDMVFDQVDVHQFHEKGER